jgi:hypothetical protein
MLGVKARLIQASLVCTSLVAGMGVHPEPAKAPFMCGPRDAEWQKWFFATFGSGSDLYRDGPDPSQLSNLKGAARAKAVKMLRRGIEACDPFAVSAVEGAKWRDLVPDLTRAATAPKGEFQLRVILALKRLGSADDFSNELIAGLTSDSERVRVEATVGARLFPLARMRAPLLERVRTDPSWLVRSHAAESLLDVADIYPRNVNEHPAIAKELFGDEAFKGPALPGPSPAPDLRERARLARAAALLDAAIDERLGQGPCPKPTPFARVSLHALSVNERAVALAVEESLGACERTLSFVVVLESPGGFDCSPELRIVGKEVLRTSIPTLPNAVSVTITRATKQLVVGSFVLDTRKANVALLVAGPSGVTSKYQAVQSLTFERRVRPEPDPMEQLGLSPEVPPLVRAVIDRTPELSAIRRQR